MTDIPLSALIATLVALLVASGFFSMAETAMMAANRYRLKVRADQGHIGAQLALDLLAKTDKLLGVILLFNNLINASAATLVSVISIELFGSDQWALAGGTIAVTFLILIFSEIAPKVVGASRANVMAPAVSFVLAPLLRTFNWVISFVNIFVFALLALLRLKPAPDAMNHQLSPQELRALVLEAGHYIPTKHRSILLNMFELENVTVEDVMTPHGQIEAIDIDEPLEIIKEKLATGYHTRLPIYEDEPGNIKGILHQRRVLGALVAGELDHAALRERLTPPYFIPGTTPIYSQLQFFQENQQRIALVVDEYGEIQGLVTVEDLVEEMIGKFTTTVPTNAKQLAWSDDGSALVEGSRTLRELNRKLGITLPLTGPKTLNGLIIEHFEDIPESGMSVKIADVPMEIVQTRNRMVRTVRLYRPVSREGQ